MSRGKKKQTSGQLYGGLMNRNPVPEIDTESKPHKEPGMAMSVEDMADQLSIGRNIAYQLVQQPDFPSFMIGRRVLISRKGLQEWIDNQCKKDPGTSADVNAPES